MNIENLTPGDQHRKLVDEINKLYPNYFKKRKGHVHSHEVHTEISFTDVNHLAALSSRIFNMSGASIGNIDLYELFQAYFLDEEKRKKINEIIK